MPKQKFVTNESGEVDWIRVSMWAGLAATFIFAYLLVTGLEWLATIVCH